MGGYAGALLLVRTLVIHAEDWTIPHGNLFKTF